MQFSRFRFYHPAPALLTMFLVANAANMAIAAIGHSLLKSLAFKLTNGETAEIRILLQMLFAVGVAGFVTGVLTLLIGLRRAATPKIERS